MSRRLVRGASALAATLFVLGAPAAQAATVSVTGGTLEFTAGDGEWNLVDFWTSDLPQGVVLSDYGAELLPGPGCAPVADPLGLPDVYYSVECAGVTSAEVTLGDDDDEIFSSIDVPVTVDAGEGWDGVFLGSGDDEVDGGAGEDWLFAGPGADTVRGGDGDDLLGGDEGLDGEDSAGSPDTLDGGAGDDWLMGGGATDTLSGGDGSDAVSYEDRTAPVTVTLDGVANDGEPGENDGVAADVEGAAGGRGADTLVGNDGNGSFYGRSGNDVVEAGGGDDTLVGGFGEDTLNAGNGADHVTSTDDPDVPEEAQADRVECGDGAPDKVLADALDVIGGGCEEVERAQIPGVTPPPVVVAAPPAAPAAVTMRAKRKKKKVTFSGRLLVPPGTDPKVCAGMTIDVEVRSPKKRVGLRTVKVGANCRFKTTLRLPRRKGMVARGWFRGTSALQAAVTRPTRVRR